jgi:uncharacterized protein YndB with AHSA1/START domain
MSEETIVMERMFDADAETLYEAWTDPKVMAQWFFVDPTWSAEVENELRVGGTYRLAMVLSTDERHTMSGEYLELEPHRRIRFTWNSHVVDNSRITIEIEPVGDRTRLRLTHELIPSEEARQAHRAGWGGCLDNLARALG